MKIKIDEKNKTVIAYGGWHGKKIVAVAVCENGDKFDEKFGTELATRKWKIKRRRVRLRYYESKASAYQALADWATHMANDYRKFAEAVRHKISKEVAECEDFVENYYSE